MKVKKVKKSPFHFSGKSLKVKKVKSESAYFSLSNPGKKKTLMEKNKNEKYTIYADYLKI